MNHPADDTGERLPMLDDLPKTPRIRFYQRTPWKWTGWLVAVALMWLLLGLVFSPRYWRF